MADYSISQLPDADPIAADDLTEVSQPSASTVLQATTISSADYDRSYSDSDGNFILAGFTVGMRVRVSGFAAAGSNIASGLITSLTSERMVIGGDDGETIETEAAGATVRIEKWESRRARAGGLARRAVHALASNAGAVAVDAALGDYFTLALTENVTAWTLSNLAGAGYATTLLVRITQDASPRTVTWPASFRWAGGAAQVVSTGAGAVDVLAATTWDQGATWFATLHKALA